MSFCGLTPRASAAGACGLRSSLSKHTPAGPRQQQALVRRTAGRTERSRATETLQAGGGPPARCLAAPAFTTAEPSAAPRSRSAPRASRCTPPNCLDTGSAPAGKLSPRCLRWPRGSTNQKVGKRSGPRPPGARFRGLAVPTGRLRGKRGRCCSGRPSHQVVVVGRVRLTARASAAGICRPRRDAHFKGTRGRPRQQQALVMQRRKTPLRAIAKPDEYRTIGTCRVVLRRALCGGSVYLDGLDIVWTNVIHVEVILSLCTVNIKGHSWLSG
jgi:hypothetical protein